jgi:ATP-dependent protease ClpP protease subunit
MVNGSIDAATTKQFLTEFHSKEVANSGPIFIVLRTPGGIVPYGMEITRAIAESKNETVCVVDEYAMSMGFYIFQACDKRIMLRGAMLMMHHPFIDATAQMDENDKLFLEALFQAMCEQMSLKMKITAKELEELIGNKDAFWTWRDAKKYGMIDRADDTVHEALQNAFLHQP